MLDSRVALLSYDVEAMKDSHEKREISIEVESDDSKAPILLAAQSGLPVARIKRAMQCGAVWLTRHGQTTRLRRAGRTLRTGDRLDLYYDPAVLQQTVDDATLIDDVGQYSVWHKPYGMWSHGSRWADHSALTRFASQALSRESLIVHRLDRATNGLMLIAHNKRAAAALSALFRERQIEKHYQAVVAGCLLADASIAIDAPLDGRAARTDVSVISIDERLQRSEVSVRIHTGRKHQVRRHLAHIGHPVVGDRLYGGAGEGDPDLQLTASRLAFQCPVRQAPADYRL